MLAPAVTRVRQLFALILGFFAACALAGGGVAGCSDDGPGTWRPPSTTLCDPRTCAPCDCDGGCPHDQFDSHTRHTFATEAELLAFSKQGDGRHRAKMLIADLGGPGARVHYYEPDFFQMHDEFWWYHLLNGKPVPMPGCEQAPLNGMRFDSIAAIYTAAEGMHPLPLKLKRAGERIYSKRFYDLVMRDDEFTRSPGWHRHLAAAGIAFHPPRAGRSVPGALWTIGLEYGDHPSYADIEAIFAAVDASLPAEMASRVYWMARTFPPQEDLVAAIRKTGLPIAKRVLVEAELVVPGDFAVYNPGITAGKIRRVAKHELANPQLAPWQIAVLDGAPDDLPPVAGILTSVPQTPQSHLGLLAKSRGTPNGFAAGPYQDPVITKWADEQQPVIMSLQTGAPPAWKALGGDQWSKYIELLTGLPKALTPVDILTIGHTVTLPTAQFKDRDAAIATIGGKAAGFLALHEVLGSGGKHGVVLPPDAMAITVRGYAEHFAAVREQVDAALSDWWFTDDPRVRMLTLQGKAAFLATWPGQSQQKWLKQTLDYIGTESSLGALIAAGGLPQRIRDLKLDPTWLNTVREALKARFSGLSAKQGLRFRSSSTAEDIAGFSGAGLYESETGFIDAASDPKKRTIGRAIKEVWASYWRFAAFEERRLAGIPQLKGRMALLVHPRFDDDLEQANGVMVLTARKDGGKPAYASVLNTQAGALSVTNPPPGKNATPEVVHVSGEPATKPVVQHNSASSDVPAGTNVLSDTQAAALHTAAAELADRWLARLNAALPAKARHRTLVLDFEYRAMKKGWPQLKDAPKPGPSLVLKQIRPLTPMPRIPLTAYDFHHAPQDMHAAGVRLDRRVCTSKSWAQQT